MSALTEKQKRQLRTLGHNLKPVVIIGQAGLSESIFEEINAQIEAHELIKVRVNADTREARDAYISNILERTHTALAQKIGHVILIYRGNAKKPKIKLESISK